MGFFQRLKQFLTPEQKPPLLDFDVRCARCGEIIHGQIHLYNDPSPEYQGDEVYYTCRKGLVGSGETRCFQEVVVEYTFDAERNVIERRIEGGEFLDEES